MRGREGKGKESGAGWADGWTMIHLRNNCGSKESNADYPYKRLSD